MSGRFLDFYRREWPRVGAVLAMALGGGSLLATRKNQPNLRALAVGCQVHNRPSTALS